MLTKAQIKHLQSLKLKKYRQNYDEFVIEGDKLITEALLGNAEVILLVATEEWFYVHRTEIPDNIPIETATMSTLEKLTSMATAPPVIAVLKQKIVDENKFINPNEWIVALDGINDPGNLGTILRTCWWFGITKIVCSLTCVELYNPKVIQSSMGAIFRVDVMYTDLNNYLHKNKLPVYGATLHGENIEKISFKASGIMIIGSESHGISPEILPYCKHQITIAKSGDAESLNAGVAAGILLHELRKQTVNL